VEAASNEPTKMVETAKPPRTLPNSYLDPQAAPIFKSNKCNLGKAEKYFKVAKAIVPPISLIVAVLGSIFSGIATPVVVFKHNRQGNDPHCYHASPHHAS
jgi:TRAP-type mannitol/chloroaromatic compound transport system permease large subunit